MTVRLSLALDYCDRHLPLSEGLVKIQGVEADVLFHHSAERHKRMLHHGEFDICELSLSSFLIGASRGYPLVAIPIFPRRLFSQSNVFVSVASGIRTPADLTGKRVGVVSYQNTMSVLAKGDLETVYNVPTASVNWFTSRPEPIPIEFPAWVSVTRVPSGEMLDDMLATGKLDAIVSPDTPRPFREGISGVARLFPDSRSEELAYLQQRSYYPIMHLIVIRADLAAAHPWLATEVFLAFEKAKEICFNRYFQDPTFSYLAWASLERDAQRQLSSTDLWSNGVQSNRQNLADFIGYSHRQGLIPQRCEVEELFHPSLLHT